MSDYFGKDVPKLGFGLMRLPKKGVKKDIEQFKTMVDMFLEAGFTYFDTAYVYIGSEAGQDPPQDAPSGSDPEVPDRNGRKSQNA